MDTNKVSVPDKDGYYTVQLGHVVGSEVSINIGTANEKTVLYPVNSMLQAIADLKNTQETLLLGEMGRSSHIIGSNAPLTAIKFNTIDPSNISHEIGSLYIAPIDGTTSFKIIGRIKPTGTHGQLLEARLQDSDSEPQFGLRAITLVDVVPFTGIEIRDIKKIITWDWIL